MCILQTRILQTQKVLKTGQTEKLLVEHLVLLSDVLSNICFLWILIDHGSEHSKLYTWRDQVTII